MFKYCAQVEDASSGSGEAALARGQCLLNDNGVSANSDNTDRTLAGTDCAADESSGAGVSEAVAC